MNGSTTTTMTTTTKKKWLVGAFIASLLMIVVVGVSVGVSQRKKGNGQRNPNDDDDDPYSTPEEMASFGSSSGLGDGGNKATNVGTPQVVAKYPRNFVLRNDPQNDLFCSNRFGLCLLQQEFFLDGYQARFSLALSECDELPENSNDWNTDSCNSCELTAPGLGECNSCALRSTIQNYIFFDHDCTNIDETKTNGFIKRQSGDDDHCRRPDFGATKCLLDGATELYGYDTEFQLGLVCFVNDDIDFRKGDLAAAGCSCYLIATKDGEQCNSCLLKSNTGSYTFFDYDCSNIDHRGVMQYPPAPAPLSNNNDSSNGSTSSSSSLATIPVPSPSSSNSNNNNVDDYSCQLIVDRSHKNFGSYLCEYQLSSSSSSSSFFPFPNLPSFMAMICTTNDFVEPNNSICSSCAIMIPYYDSGGLLRYGQCDWCLNPKPDRFPVDGVPDPAFDCSNILVGSCVGIDRDGECIDNNGGTNAGGGGGGGGGGETSEVEETRDEWDLATDLAISDLGSDLTSMTLDNFP